MMSKTNKNAVVIPEEMKWLFNPDKDSQSRREKFVKEFFGLDKMEKKVGNTKKGDAKK